MNHEACNRTEANTRTTARGSEASSNICWIFCSRSRRRPSNTAESQNVVATNVTQMIP